MASNLPLSILTLVSKNHTITSADKRKTLELIHAGMAKRGTPVSYQQLSDYIVVTDADSEKDEDGNNIRAKLLMVHYVNEKEILEKSKKHDPPRQVVVSSASEARGLPQHRVVERYDHLLHIRGLIVDLVEERCLDFGYGHSIQINTIGDIRYTEDGHILPADVDGTKERLVRHRKVKPEIHSLVNFYMGYPGIVIRHYTIHGKVYLCTYRKFNIDGFQPDNTRVVPLEEQLEQSLLEDINNTRKEHGDPLLQPTKYRREANRTYAQMLHEMTDGRGLSVLDYLEKFKSPNFAYYLHLTEREFLQAGPTNQSKLTFMKAFPVIGNNDEMAYELRHDRIERRLELTMSEANAILTGVNIYADDPANRDNGVRIRRGNGSNLSLDFDEKTDEVEITYTPFSPKFRAVTHNHSKSDFPINSFIIAETFVESEGIRRSHTYEIHSDSFLLRNYITNSTRNLYNSFLNFLYHYRFVKSQFNENNRERLNKRYRDTIKYRPDVENNRLIGIMMNYLNEVSPQGIFDIEYLKTTYANAETIFRGLVPDIYHNYLDYLFNRLSMDRHLVYTFVRDFHILPWMDYLKTINSDKHKASLINLTTRIEDLHDRYKTTKYITRVGRGIRTGTGGPYAFYKLFASEVPSSQYRMIREIVDFYNRFPDEYRQEPTDAAFEDEDFPDLPSYRTPRKTQEREVLAPPAPRRPTSMRSQRRAQLPRSVAEAPSIPGVAFRRGTPMRRSQASQRRSQISSASEDDSEFPQLATPEPSVFFGKPANQRALRR